jgi:hypothetical protein
MNSKSILSIFISSSLLFWAVIVAIGCRKETPREFPDTYRSSSELCTNGILDNGEYEIDCGGSACPACTPACTHPANIFTWTSSFSNESLTITNVSCVNNIITATAAEGYTITFTFVSNPQSGYWYNTSANSEYSKSVDIYVDTPVGPNYLQLYSDYQTVYVTTINGNMAITVCDIVLEQESNSFQQVLDGTIICN